jgi:hypothetical protein
MIVDHEDNNSRIFDEPDANLKEKIVIFEYKNYLTSEQMNKKTNLLLYVIEKGNGDNPYIYYLMNKINNIITLPTLYLKSIKQAHEYMSDKFEKSKYNLSCNKNLFLYLG